MSVTSLNRGQTHVVNERVVGTRRFSVGGQSPLSHDPYRNGTRSTVTLWTGIEWKDGTVAADGYGKEFRTSDEWHEYNLVHGYTRPYFTNDHLRINRILKANGAPRSMLSGIYRLNDREAMKFRAWLKRGDVHKLIRMYDATP